MLNNSSSPIQVLAVHKTTVTIIQNYHHSQTEDKTNLADGEKHHLTGNK